MVDPELLKLLCCPETHQPLHLANAAVVDELNQRIGSAELRNRAGRKIAEKIEAGLVREDGKCLYPVRKRIPVMLLEEAIPLH